MATYEDIDYEIEAGIATITIGRAEVRNAFRRETIADLNDALREVENDDSVYVVVLTGAEDGFCAGADVSTMANWSEGTKEAYGNYLWNIQNVVRQLRGMAKPSIAAVAGPAVGAGCDFALACDLRVVGSEGFFREGFVRVGLIPGDGGAWLLPRLIGESKAREYLLTGRDISPEDAVDLGLAVEERGDALDGAYELAAELLDLPAVAVRHTNSLVDPQQGFEDYCERAIEYQWECVNDAEHDEAIAAFGEGRDPEYDREY
jgi:enoyl-CoA hydratase/carnithine racemase